MKKTIIIILIVFAVAALIFLGFYLRSRKESGTPPPAAGTRTLPTVQLPRTAGNTQNAGQATGLIENLKRAVDSPVLDYFVDAKNSMTFVQPDGQILKTGGNGPILVSASIVKNIARASFSFDGKKVLVVIANPSGDQASIFDMERKTWQPLPQNTNSPAWSPSDYQIAYFSGTAERGSVLSFLDAANSVPKPKTLLPLRQEDMTLNWLSPNQILVADKTSALWNSSLWSFDPAKKIIAPIIQDRPGLQTVWSYSPASVGLIFSASQNQQGGRLQLVDKSGNPLKQLSFLTLPSKCVFRDKPAEASTQFASSTAATTSPSTSLGAGAPTSAASKTRLTLICAVPRDQQTLSVNALPDAYQEKALFTSDDFFEINVDDGSVKTLQSDPAKNFDASNIKVFNQSIFFVNRFDKKVYSVPLAP